ncbi:MAG: peptidyl-prolyl cis-trans isomerase [Acidobacteria bacterium]|nr:peptidyl-prolyl cis-trans isomerase [Acidobacteriota bacterium]
MKPWILATLMIALAPLPLVSQTRGSSPQAAPVPAPKAKPRVVLETSFGTIELELEPALAPATVENFLRYVREGHYAGTVFHRVIPNFMIQGGGHLEDLAEKPTRAPIRNEAPASAAGGLRNTRGTVAMARTGEPHSATAQFFINTKDNPFLDNKDTTTEGYGYCAFGRVVAGMETVEKIEKVRTVWRRGMQNVPEFAVRIKAARIVEAR